MNNERESQLRSVHNEVSIRNDLNRKFDSVAPVKISRNTHHSLHFRKQILSISKKNFSNSANILNKNNCLSSVLSQVHLDNNHRKDEIEKELEKDKEIRKKFQKGALIDKTKINSSSLSRENKIEEKSLMNSDHIQPAEPVFKTGIFQVGISKSQYYTNNDAVTCEDKIKEDTFLLVPSVKMKIYRTTNFRVNYIPGWFQKIGIPCRKLTQDTVNNLEFQYLIISDELKVLLDNIQQYKMLYLGDSNILTIFKSIDSRYQVHLNSIIEETCGLMLELSYDILFDFSNFMEKFVSVKPPKPSNFKIRSVKNEEAEFLSNISIFNDVSSFLAACFEAYLILAKQVEDMILPFKIFIKVHQYLARSRFNVSNMVFSTQNFDKNVIHDQNLLIKYRQEMSKGMQVKEYEKEISGVGEDERGETNYRVVPANKVGRRTKSHDLTDKMREQYTFKLNQETERRRRLDAVLQIKREEEEDSFERKKKKVSKQFVRHIGIEDKILDKILKYCPKNIKDQIISERLLKRFEEKNKEHDCD